VISLLISYYNVIFLLFHFTVVLGIHCEVATNVIVLMVITFANSLTVYKWEFQWKLCRMDIHR